MVVNLAVMLIGVLALASSNQQFQPLLILILEWKNPVLRFEVLVDPRLVQ